MLQIFLFIVISCSLTACLPAVFTAATSTTVVAAKDQPISEYMSDVKIAGAINTSFRKNNFRELYTKIKVEVEQGRVLFTGIIDKEEDALLAVEIAWNVKGVKEVINELKVDKNSDYFDLVQYTKDMMITAQIKAKTFLKRDIKFVNYTIVTVNNIVYIFGMARSEEELGTVADISSKIKGVEKVVCHTKIIDLPQKENYAQDEINDDNI